MPDATKLDALTRSSESAAVRLDGIAERVDAPDRAVLALVAAFLRTVPTLARAAVADVGVRRAGEGR